MKEYKVGDTIYIKDEIETVDQLDSYRTYRGIHNGWLANISIVDELPIAEPVKPVLPKDVADELIEAKTFGYNFLGYMNVALDNEYPSTNMFSFDGDDVHVNKKIKTLSDAWYNGYTVEKPKLYNLVLGKNMWGWPLALYKPTGNDNNLIAYPDAAPKYLRDSVYQFTQEEIDKYNKSFWIKNIDLNDYKVEVTADIQTKEVEE